MKKHLIALSIAGSALMVGTAFANPIATDLPSDTYVIQDGLKWTWASPVNEEFFNSNVLSDPSFHIGWRFATNAELANIPSLADFDFGNIQSTAYWNSEYTHVDVSDFTGGYFASLWGHDAYETFYVSAVPEPGAYAMLLAGLGLLGFMARRRKGSAV